MSELNTLATIMIILCIMHLYYFVKGLMKDRRECQCEWLKIKLEAAERQVERLEEKELDMVRKLEGLRDGDSSIISTSYGYFLIIKPIQEATP